MKMAKASKGEWTRLFRWLQAQEAAGVNVPPWERTVFGYDVLVENVCDPEKDYLDWKPGIVVHDDQPHPAVIRENIPASQTPAGTTDHIPKTEGNL